MSESLFHFLAARGDDDWIKFVIGGIAVAIWLLGSLAQAMSKKKEPPTSGPDYRTPEEIERAHREEIQRRIQDLTGVNLPTPPAPPQQGQGRARKPLPAKAVKQRRTVPPPPAPVYHEPALPPAPAMAPAQPAAQTVKKPRVIVDAGTLHRWLNPNTLRQQFILTEILQKPIALRPDRLDDL